MNLKYQMKSLKITTLDSTVIFLFFSVYILFMKLKLYSTYTSVYKDNICLLKSNMNTTVSPCFQTITTNINYKQLIIVLSLLIDILVISNLSQTQVLWSASLLFEPVFFNHLHVLSENKNNVAWYKKKIHK